MKKGCQNLNFFYLYNLKKKLYKLTILYYNPSRTVFKLVYIEN